MLCIDVGIKNLAICIGSTEGIKHWDVYKFEIKKHLNQR
jgi:transposase